MGHPGVGGEEQPQAGHQGGKILHAEGPGGLDHPPWLADARCEILEGRLFAAVEQCQPFESPADRSAVAAGHGAHELLAGVGAPAPLPDEVLQ